jgi:putative thioredoxin
MLQQAVATKPDDDDARFEYVKALLLAGRLDDARTAFAPVASKAATVRRLDSLQRVMAAATSRRHKASRPKPSPHSMPASRPTGAISRPASAAPACWRAQHRWTEAMDELLEILMRDKAWNEDAARKTYIAILDVIEPPKPKVAEGQIPPDDPTVATYRRRLSSVVLS